MRSLAVDAHTVFLESSSSTSISGSFGNGGDGGDVFLIADEALNTLVDFRYQPSYQARNGQGGGSRNKTGAAGDAIYVKVPMGTTVVDEETQEVLGDLSEIGQTLKVAAGGGRGLGNAAFKSSTNRSPRRTTRSALALDGSDYCCDLADGIVARGAHASQR